jgi:lipopolysaccharide export LptBFGC system permease protein LptF
MELLIDTLLKIALVAATGFLFVIILLAYLRIRSKRLLLIAAGFAVFFLHALLYMPEIMFQSITLGFSDDLHIALNLVALLLIALGIIREEK